MTGLEGYQASSVEMSNRVRSGYINAEQKEMMVEFMKEHPELRSGKFSAKFTTQNAQQLWMVLAQELHKIPNGAVKEWKQWRKVSREIRMFIPLVVHCVHNIFQTAQISKGHPKDVSRTLTSPVRSKEVLWRSVLSGICYAHKELLKLYMLCILKKPIQTFINISFYMK